MTTKEPGFLGQTSGTAVTAGNSDDFGDPILNTFALTGCTAVYDNAGGVYGIVVSDGGTGTNTAALGYSGFSGTSFRTAIDFTTPSALPSGGTHVFGSWRSAGGQLGNIGINTTGKIVITWGGATLFTSTNSVAPNTRYEARYGIVIDSAAGSIQGGLYPFNSNTVIAGSSPALTGQNLGSTAFTELRFAKTASGPVVGAIKFNRIRIDDTTATPHTMYVAAAPPTITASADQTVSNPGSQVNVTATGSPNGSATIVSYQWGWVTWPPGSAAPTINNASAATANFTPTVRGRYMLGVTCTDSLGQQSQFAYTVVNIPDTSIFPLEFVNTNGWTLGQASDVQDNSDTTKEDSGGVGSATVLTVRLAPLVPTTAGFRPLIRSYVEAAAGTQKIELVEGANSASTASGTVRFTWPAVSPAVAAAGDVLLADPGSAALGAITDWNNLFLRFTQV